MRRVVVGMSGGVDSSVAALLLQRRGFDVVGLYMRNWDAADERGESPCPHDADLRDAGRVCDQLGIPLRTVEFVSEYWMQVWEPSLAQFQKGDTPNPDVLCNREIKFSAFKRHAEDLGADVIATGHYARLHERPAGPALLAGVDATKDQSYFLSQTPLSAFRDVVFPLGDLTKRQVRALAKESGLATAEKRESMGVCFVGKRKFSSFLRGFIETTAGSFVDVRDGREVARHEGAELFTIGQRARVGGVGEALYVCGKDVASGAVFLAPADHPSLYSDRLFLRRDQLNWLGSEALRRRLDERPIDVDCRVRHLQPLVRASLRAAPDREDLYELAFREPERAVTVGQALAVYAGEQCIAGAPICAVARRAEPLPPTEAEAAAPRASCS